MALTIPRIYGSAPTHVAVDNFATRLYAISSKVTQNYNEGKSVEDPTRLRRKLVIRAYREDEEHDAFWRLLKQGASNNSTEPNSQRNNRSKHQVPLSMAYWMLVLLGPSAVGRELHPDDSKALHTLRAQLDKSDGAETSGVTKIFALVKQEITWDQFEKDGKVNDSILNFLMDRIRDSADIICTTPALACRNPYKLWRVTKAGAIAVDEAGNMTRPDLYSVWGNTLLPCALGGDDKQLPPAIMTGNEPLEVSPDGRTTISHVNRFAPDGKISPLEFFKASGMPVYRLRTQLRMAENLFHLCHEYVYNDIKDVSYGPSCKITMPIHDIGQHLEDYVVEKFGSKGLKPAPAGTFEPIFINCLNSRTNVNLITGSKSSVDQSRAALDFIQGFVETKKVDAGRIVLITPYMANVEVIRKLRSHYPTLVAIDAASTVDSFQGQEGDISVVVLGTTKFSGPGFLTDAGRLNVALSRQRSGLIVVADINTTGLVDRNRRAATKGQKTDSKPQKTESFLVIGSDGRLHFTKAGMLDHMFSWFLQSGRIIDWEC